MVDNFTGKWTPEKDYSTYPKGKWCDMDIVCDYIKKQNYTPKEVDMEMLILRVLDGFANETVDCDSQFYHSYVKDGMVNVEVLAEFVEASGGLKEFDYKS